MLTREKLMFVFDASESTVDEWQRLKLVDHFKLGRMVRFEPHEVLAFIFRHTLRGRRSQTGNIANGQSPIAEQDMALLWERVQRFVVLQVRAELTKQIGNEPGHMAA